MIILVSMASFDLSRATTDVAQTLKRATSPSTRSTSRTEPAR
jgi:hypothetical protein